MKQKKEKRMYRYQLAFIRRCLLVLLVVCLPMAQSTSFSSEDGEDTLTLLQSTVIPPRDPLDLAQRLLGVTSIPEPPTTAPPEYNIGDVLTFHAENVDEDFSFEVEAELLYKTPHIYMFVEQEYADEIDLEGLKHSAETFENEIRPKVHEIFGTEWLPGIDADPHLYILHTTRLGYTVAAYYASQSEYPSEAVEDSNEHEMFFVNLDAMGGFVGTEYYEGVLAHEFQHMVQWHVDQNEDTWLNEGLSELAAMVTGYGSSSFAYSFLASPKLQLTAWPENEDRGIHYGAAFMLVAYFYERYGEEATTTLIQNPANGLTSIEETLASIEATDPITGEPVTLTDLFGDWLVTILLNDTSIADGRYGYQAPELVNEGRASIYEEISISEQPVETTTPQWGPDYLLLPADAGRLRFTFDGTETISLVPADAHSGQYMWWGNRADMSDTRLTHSFDLSTVDSATLHFWTWYYIEDLWDYGYAMISTDGGATWTPLKTVHMTTNNPHGNAYGPGYTGQSEGWIEETIDLTPYVGQEIQIRFEYMTDDAVTQPGMLIDDVSIPEIGFSDDFENGDGEWVSEGWLRMDNLLPQHYLIQLVQPNAETPVTRLLGPGDEPHGEWEIEVNGEETVIIVSGLTPVTTEPAAYTYTLVDVQ